VRTYDPNALLPSFTPCIKTLTHTLGVPPKDDRDGEIKGDPQLLLVSGLGLGGADVDPLAVDMLVDFVTGSLGSGTDHEEAARIVKVRCQWFA